MKFGFKSKLLFLSVFLAVFLLSGLVFINATKAQEEAKNPADAIDACKNLGAVECGGGSGAWNCSAGIKAITKCIEVMETANAGLITANDWIVFVKEVARDELKQQILNSLAGAWKSMWRQFAQQMAYDTATWVASGGKGQQPLFITEGWGAYLKNTADEAVGAFIDSIDDQLGTNLCEPDLEVRIAIKTGIDWRRIEEPSCSFTELVNNWESAINNASFNIEYVNSLRPGSNDISAFLTLQTGVIDDANFNLYKGALQIASDSGWKNVENFIGEILTPGSLIRNAVSVSYEEAAKSDVSTFTASIWDFIETFLNTLVGKLLNRLQTGFFDDTGSSSGNSLNLPNFSSLFNPEASPSSAIGGTKGAENSFATLKESTVKSGGTYDILNKLTQCSDADKSNPGQTDCVIDEALANEIRKLTAIKNLPDSIKNRKFSPLVADVANPQVEFSLRSIIILRKYRIVPVGWEIAARYINQYSKQNYTLAEVMAGFSVNSSPFFGLVDPDWVLKAPELFCRRLGYGEKDTLASQQNSDISRQEECVDEQQCIKEDADGKCAAYGYCTEEKRVWDFNGKTCDARFNTCQTFTGRGGQTISYLANTLDFGNCDSQSAGCKWYSLLFDPVSGGWFHTSPGDSASQATVLNTCTTPTKGYNGCLVSGANKTVEQWHNTNSDSSVIMPSACTTEGGCGFSGQSCVIPVDGTQCSPEVCLEGNNLLAGKNSSFENGVSGQGAWNAQYWEEGYSDLNNGFSRVEKQGQNNSWGLKAYALSNGADIPTSLSLDGVTLANKSRYSLQFYARGQFNNGGIVVQISGQDGSVLGGYSLYPANVGSLWQAYSFSFTADASANYTLKIITRANSSGNVWFDDFSLKQIEENCADQQAFFTLGSRNTISSEQEKEIYFDKDVQACAASAEGCSQFIRTKEGLGSNLLPNGGFEDSAYNNLGNLFFNDNSNSASATLTFNGEAHSGGQAVKLNIASLPAGGWSQLAIRDWPGSEVFIDGKYIFSGWVKWNKNNSDAVPAVQGDLSLMITNKFNPYTTFSSCNFTPSADWQFISCAFTVPNAIFVNDKNQIVNAFQLVVRAAKLGDYYIDDLKLEKVFYNSDQATSYTSYNPSERPTSQLAYLKKAPDYYKCYGDGVWPILSSNDNNRNTFGYDKTAVQDKLESILSQPSPACDNFAKVCSPLEVGCELYTPTDKDPAVSGVISSADVCPDVCVGYQSYYQRPTNFVDGKYQQFIANSAATYCSAAYAGCDEFTNLDEVAQGGESKEYYSQLKVCQKSTTDRGVYYTWEGSDTTGYQLKVYNLKKSNLSNGNAPCVNLSYNADGTNYCSDNSNNIDTTCSKDQMSTNPDCREFYDQSGNISYRLLSKTVTISDDCHPYRRTLGSGTQIDCQNSNGYWNGNGECIYMAIPNEGQTCPASAAGCREYAGAKANNVRNIFLDNFDNAGATNWTNGTLSAVATMVGGQSLENVTACSGEGESRRCTIHQQLKKDNIQLIKNRAYILSFWAKGNGSFILDSINFSTTTSNGVRSVTGTFANSTTNNITAEWQRYELGPIVASWGEADTFINDLEFNLPSGATIYLDNILLKEVKQDIFVIENSWLTPVACDNSLDDPDGQKAIAAGTCGANNANAASGRCSQGAMLGCKAYTDRSSQTWNLKSFANICRQEAVGCERLIDTHNSEALTSLVANSGDSSQITTPTSTVIYLVNDSKYSCSADNKGCTALGLPVVNQYDEVSGYSTVYLKNQPDRYNFDLCQANQLWCEQFTGSRSTYYFKDPRSKLCEYREGSGWMVVGQDTPCDTVDYQTIGNSVLSEKLQPRGWYDNFTGAEDANYQGYAGLCPATQSGCTEYIDPLADIYTDLLGNDGWSGNAKTVNLDTHTLYTLQIKNLANATILCNQPMVSPDLSLSLSGDKKIATLVGGASGQFSGRFYINTNIASNISLAGCRVSIVGAKSADNVTLVRSGVYYNLADSVDRTSCNGLVDFNNNCVLFNERGSISYGQSDPVKRFQSYLSFDADATAGQNGVSPVKGSGAQADSNVVIKVSPNRQCYSWLYCTSYQKNSDNDTSLAFGSSDKCLDTGLCTAMDAQGNCLRLVDYSKNYKTSGVALPATAEYSLSDKNKSGYSWLGLGWNDNGVNEAGAQQTQQANWNGTRYISGYYPFQQMTQFGLSASVANGSFSSVVNGSEPLGWTLENDSDGKGWQSYKFAVEGDKSHLLEGGSYLTLNACHQARSEDIDVVRNQTYVLSGFIETLDLQPKEAIAEILIYRINNDGQILNADGQGVITNSNDIIYVKAGLPWTKVSREITTDANTVRLRLVLANWKEVGDDKVSCSAEPKVGGASRFDNIDIKPVLVASQSDAIARSCRAYPEQSSLSCQYYKNNNFYYGWYGYCLARDPNNSQMCLQWWPVDQLEGEQLDEISGSYQGRYPLYYCLEQKREMVKVSKKISTVASGSGGVDIDLVEDIISSFVGSGGQKEYVFEPFDAPNAYKIFFRYPYVQKFDIGGMFLGVFGQGNWAASIAFFNGSMWPETATIWGAGGSVIGTGDFGVILIPPIKQPIFQGLLGKLKDFNFNELLDFTTGQNPGALGNINDGDNDSINTGTAICQTYQSEYDQCLAQADYCTADEISDLNEKIAVCNQTATNTALGDQVDSVLNKLGIFQGVVEFFSNLKFDGIIGKIQEIFSSFSQSSGSDEWGGWTFGCATLMKGRLTICIPLGWSFGGVVADLSTVASGGIMSMLQTGIEDLTFVGAKIVTDQDQEYASKFTDPFPDIEGDILGVVWRHKSSGLGGLMVNANVFTSMPVNYCSDVAQVVTPTGKNKAWAKRVASGSGYTFDRNKIANEDAFETASGIAGGDKVTIKYGTDYQPFGAMVPPSNNIQNPTSWDSRTAEDGFTMSSQPMFKEPTRVSLGAPYQPRMGSLVSNNTVVENSSGKVDYEATQNANEILIQQLFAQSYGRWYWQPADTQHPSLAGSYVRSNNLWSLPTTPCAGNVRPANCSNDNICYCYITPIVDDLKINDKSDGQETINGRGAVKLSFTAEADPDQLPITSYTVYWGDGTTSQVSGVSLRNRTNTDNPFNVYHFYDFYQVSNCKSVCNRVCVGDTCTVTATIQIKDNWGKGSEIVPVTFSIKSGN